MSIKETLKTILSTADERHSFIVGFAHSFYRSRKPPEKYMEEVISPEYHYYCCGRGAGTITIVTAIAVLLTVIWRRRSEDRNI